MLLFNQLHEGTQIRLARIAAGLTLFDIGSRADVSPPRLSEFERGRLTLAPEVVGRIRDVLIDPGAPITDDTHGTAA